MANPSKSKGTKMETNTVRYLSWALQDERIERMPLHGAKDVGDIAGVRFHGGKVCVECKDTKQPKYAAHWLELLDEMGNADAEYGVLIQHAKGQGVDVGSMGWQMAIMTRDMLDAFTAPYAPTAIPEVVQTVAMELAGTERTLRGHCGPLVWIPLCLWALLVNDLQPLGPDGEGGDE